MYRFRDGQQSVANDRNRPSWLGVGPRASLRQRRRRLGRIKQSNVNHQRRAGHHFDEQQQLGLDRRPWRRMGVLGQLVGTDRVRFYWADQPNLYYSNVSRRPPRRRPIHRQQPKHSDGKCRNQLQVWPLVVTTSAFGIALSVSRTTQSLC